MPGPAPGQNSQLGNLNAMGGDPSEVMSQLQGGSSAGAQATPAPQQLQSMQQQMGGAQTDQAPRAIGSIGEELVKRPLADIAKGIKSIFSLDNLLGVESNKPDPQAQAKKKQLHQRFNQLSQEEQGVARERYQQEMERKQRMAEEDERSRQMKAQSKQSIVMPSSPQKGNGGQSKKQNAMQQLQDDRTKIGKVQGAS
ncbi:MAG: hypothetical protein OEX81_00495 [Candidatus Pacebacteria bacterium]|nr:hypothetical protein [Candidatus Paceibacterota bacterium]